MILRPCSKLIFSGLCSLLAVHLPLSARGEVLKLDWGHLSAAYKSGAANAATTQTFTVGGNTISTVFGDTTNQFYANTPIVNDGTSAAYTTGGNQGGELALQIGANFTANTNDIKFTINFSQAVYGVTFQFLDVDTNYNGSNTTTYVDQVRNILGADSTTGTTNIAPTLTASANNTVVNGTAGGFSNSATGKLTTAQASGDADVYVSFASNVAITSFSFQYGDNTQSSLGLVAAAEPTTPYNQIIGLSNIYYSTVSGQAVPEPGTASLLGMGALGLATVVMRRRHRS